MTVADDTRAASLQQSGTPTGEESSAGRQPVSPAGDVCAIAGVALFSDTPAELAAFYGMLLGVRFEHRVHANGSDHRIATVAGTQFEIKATTTAAGDVAPDGDAATALDGISRSETSFTVPDARASYDYALTLGAAGLIPVTTYPWGDFGTVVDPHGNRVGLFSSPSTDQPIHASTEPEKGR